MKKHVASRPECENRLQAEPDLSEAMRAGWNDGPGRVLDSAMKVLAVSGVWQGEFLHRADTLMGAPRAISKPVSPEELLQAVSEVLGMD